MRVLNQLVGVTGRDHITDDEFYQELLANYIIKETGNYREEHKAYMQQMPPYRIPRAVESTCVSDYRRGLDW
jgi:hypothetical protein